MLQKDHDIGLPGSKESRIKFYHSEAILLIRNPFECIIHLRVSNESMIIKEPDILKNLFIENKGNNNNKLTTHFQL